MNIAIYISSDDVYEEEFDLEDDDGIEYDEDGVAWWFDEDAEVWYVYDEVEDDWFEWDEELDDYYNFEQNEI